MWKQCDRKEYIDATDSFNKDNIVELTMYETIWCDRKTHTPVAKCNLGYLPKSGETSYYVWVE